jgi:hypothetical protein
MGGNKHAYDAAFQRAREGKGARTWTEVLMSPFEDEYTRQAREKGARAGAEARAAADRATADPLPD